MVFDSVNDSACVCFYSMPFIDVIQHEGHLACYVRSAIHSTSGIEANTSRIIDRIKDHLTEHVFIESNGVGLAAVILIKKQLNQHQKLSAFPSTVNKDVRILSHYEFVQRYFVFDEQLYKTDAEYRMFVDDMCSFTKEGDNKHRKDAIDVMCLSASIIKVKYQKFLYG